MKKILIIPAVMALLLAILSGCKPLDRLNPTDPAASNYIGMHYLGSIGDFTDLADFCFTADGLWAVDKTDGKIFDYFLSGDLNFSFTGTDIFTPTGICADNTYLYVVDDGALLNNVKRYDPLYVSNTAISEPPNYPALNLNKCAVNASSSKLYLTSADTVYVFDTALNNMTGLTFGGPGTLDGQFSTISDVEVHSSGNILVADSVLKRISIFDPSGAFVRKYDLAYNVQGIAVKDDYIYIPTDDGIYKINYGDGGEALHFANYGEGNGRVTAPGPCEAFGDTVYAGTTIKIKAFGP